MWYNARELQSQLPFNTLATEIARTLWVFRINTEVHFQTFKDKKVPKRETLETQMSLWNFFIFFLFFFFFWTTRQKQSSISKVLSVLVLVRIDAASKQRFARSISIYRILLFNSRCDTVGSSQIWANRELFDTLRTNSIYFNSLMPARCSGRAVSVCQFKFPAIAKFNWYFVNG